MGPKPCPGEAVELNNLSGKETDVIKLESTYMVPNQCPGEGLESYVCSESDQSYAALRLLLDSFCSLIDVGNLRKGNSKRSYG